MSRGRRVPSGALRPSLCGPAARRRGGPARRAAAGPAGPAGPSLGCADTLRLACGAFCPRGRASARFALGDTARGGRRADCRRARVSCGREARGGPAPRLPSAEARLCGHIAACVRRILSAWPSLGAFRAGRHRSRWPARGVSLSASLVRPAGAWRARAAPPVGRASAGRTRCGLRAAHSVRVSEPRRGSRWATPFAAADPRPVAQRESCAAWRRVAGPRRASRPPSLGWADTLRPACGAFCPPGRASARPRGSAASAPAAPPCSHARRAAPARGPSLP
ncbi:hypothetical protein JOD51_000873 [Curtobacterium herbarum]|nr:hypothetical protein [Curtobacterium herbarum]